MKIRGVGQSRRRWFRLTSRRLTYFTRECGDTIDYVNASDIVHVREIHMSGAGVSEIERGRGRHIDECLEKAYVHSVRLWMTTHTHNHKCVLVEGQVMRPCTHTALMYAYTYYADTRPLRLGGRAVVDAFSADNQDAFRGWKSHGDGPRGGQ